jgi:Uma2 family endonuclease
MGRYKLSIGVRNEYFYYNSKNEISMHEFMAFINLPENQCGKFEFVDGYIVAMAGNTSFNHQRISGYLFRMIGNYLEGKTCEAVQDINVYLFKDNIGNCKNVFQPDIMVGCEKDKMTDKGYEGTPDFIIEIVSKSTARTDYLIKLNRYMEYGVKEYWIVDLDKKQVLVCLNTGDNPPVIQEYTFNDRIKINTFNELVIDFNNILSIVT